MFLKECGFHYDNRKRVIPIHSELLSESPAYLPHSIENEVLRLAAHPYGDMDHQYAPIQSPMHEEHYSSDSGTTGARRESHAAKEVKPPEEKEENAKEEPKNHKPVPHEEKEEEEDKSIKFLREYSKMKRKKRKDSLERERPFLARSKTFSESAEAFQRHANLHPYSSVDESLKRAVLGSFLMGLNLNSEQGSKFDTPTPHYKTSFFSIVQDPISKKFFEITQKLNIKDISHLQQNKNENEIENEEIPKID